jgi:hypothetical protein
MPVATITPQWINAPKPGAKSGSIKDVNGEYWGVRPDDLSQFTSGVPAEVEYTEREYQGRVYKNIQRLKNPHSQGAHPGPAPAPKPQNGVGFRQPVTDQEKLDMRVTSWGHALINGNPGPFMMPGAFRDLAVRLTHELSEAKHATYSPQRADDMSDEIPF